MLILLPHAAVIPMFILLDVMPPGFVLNESLAIRLRNVLPDNLAPS